MHIDTVKKLYRKGEFISVLMCLGIILLLSITSDLFWDPLNMAALQTSIAPTAIMSIAMMILLICGYFDLSIGSTMALSGIVASKLLALNLSIPFVIAISLLVGVAVGLINGLLISYVGINSLITTIATMLIGRGLFLVLIADTYQKTVEFPKQFIHIGAGKFLNIYYMFWIMLFLIIIATIFLKYVPMGRNLYLVGGNSEAAIAMGVNRKLIVLSAFTFIGFMSALSGVLSVARYENTNRYLGENIHLLAIIACIIGGGSLFGGKGSAIGAFFGVAFMSLLSNAINLLELAPELQTIVIGVVLVVVVALDGYLSLKRQREQGKA